MGGFPRHAPFHEIPGAADINPATIDIVFSRRLLVHGKAALRRRDHFTASNANALSRPARGSLSFQISWLDASGLRGPEALNTMDIVAGLITSIHEFRVNLIWQKPAPMDKI